MASCGTVVRVAMYTLMAAAIGMLFYGILHMKAQYKPDDYCLLFGKWKTLNRTAVPSVEPMAGSNSLCHFTIFSAVAQISLAVLMTILTVIRCTTKRDKERTVYTTLEVIVLVPVLIVALATAMSITIGLYKFCGQLSDGDTWKQYYGAKVTKPSSCQNYYIIQPKSPVKYSFYHDLNIAQIGAWSAFVIWLVHTIISTISFRGYRRDKRDNSHLTDIATAEGTTVGKFKRMKNPGAL